MGEKINIDIDYDKSIINITIGMTLSQINNRIRKNSCNSEGLIVKLETGKI